MSQDVVKKVIIPAGKTVTLCNQHVSGAVEYHIGENAIANIYNTTVGGSARVQEIFFCASGSKLEYVVSMLDIERMDRTITVVLCGAHAHAQVRGLYISRADQQVFVSTYQEHRVPNATSDVQIRGVLSGNAHAQYRGSIYVHEKAQGTNAIQDNKNLLVSGDASVTSIPGLQVLANNVQCRHGSAVGSVDDEQLFFLQARGMKRKKAIELIVNGFCKGFLDEKSEERAQRAIKSLVSC